MKPEKFILYNKYKNINFPNKEFIYIGYNKKNKEYWFLSNNNHEGRFALLRVIEELDLNLKEVLFKLNFEYNNDFFQNHYWLSFKDVNNFKPLLNDKLKNILNR